MANTYIDVDSFGSTLAKQMIMFQDLVEDEIVTVEKSVAEATEDIVRKSGTFGGSGFYREQITHTPPKTKNRKTSCYVWAGNKGYRLAHLIENGHALVRGGRTVGRTQPFPHFEVAEKWLERNYFDELRKGIEKL